MDSKWLKKHTENVKELQKKGYGDKKKGVFIAMAMFAVVIGIILVAGVTNPDYNAKVPVIFVTGMAGFICIIVLLAGKKGSKTDVTKDVTKNLEELLTTPEQVAEFDEEMLGQPLCDFDGGHNNNHVIFTKHYIAVPFLNFVNLPDYRFARSKDIRKMEFAIYRDETKVFGMGKEYSIDLIGENGEKCLGVVVYGKERMAEFEELLKKYCPEIQLQEHKWLHVN